MVEDKAIEEKLKNKQLGERSIDVNTIDKSNRNKLATEEADTLRNLKSIA